MKNAGNASNARGIPCICKETSALIGNAAQADESEWRYFGLGLCGPKKLVSRLTGSMPLLR